MTDCGLSNLGGCLVGSFFDFLHELINAPLNPLLDFVKNMLSHPVNTDIFNSMWVIIIYILSIFYGLLLVYTGFRFIITSPSPEEREKSKQILKNVLIMMILVQASYFIYELFLQVSSSLTTPILNMIPESFFQITLDNVVNLGLELVFGMAYVLALLVFSILLIIRYVIVSVGLVLFPVGIFLYFLDPVKEYGKVILNFLGVNMFVTFIISIILLAFSMLIDISFFQNIKILVMMTAFYTSTWLMLKSFKFSFENTARKTSEYAVKIIKYLA